MGALTVQTLAFDIHAADHTLLWLPGAADPAGRRGADVIAAGGYGPGIIEATRVYLTALLAGDRRPFEEILAGPIREGWVHPYAAYEAVHQANLEAIGSAA